VYWKWNGASKSRREALRCLKRYIARETYRAILLDARAYLPSGQQDRSVEV
jgi:hypothetical protein